MAILVTGRDGQVAQAVRRQLGDEALIFVARPEFDLADAASIEQAIDRVRPQLIISAAAYTAVDRAESEPALAARINADAPGVIGAAARRIGAPVIHLSTDYVFPGTGDAPWSEDDIPAPINTYGQTKLAGEQALRASGATHAILRTAWVYGPDGANFVKTMLRLAGERERVAVVSDQFGNPTAAAQIAAGIAAVIAAWRGGVDPWQTGLFHFAGAGTTSWAGFAREIFRRSAALGGPDCAVDDITTAEFPTPAARPANSRLDTARFAAAFGFAFEPWPVSLQGSLAEMIGQSPLSDSDAHDRGAE